jgi:sugar transferase (PEP-CTERM system associated)
MRSVQSDIRVIGDYSQILQLANQGKVDRIVVALEERRGGFPAEELLKCRMDGIPIEDGVAFYERLAGKLLLDRVHPSFLIFSDGFVKSKLSRIAKTAMDYFFASLGLIVFIPIMGLVALAIKMDSLGPVFYRQERVGKDGRIFELLKFRSMRPDAEEETGPVWAQENDERVTRVGRIIRKLRIDEMPQMINVLRGEMSFVGPRPERRHFVDHLRREIPYYDKRLAVKPGVTGWAQIEYAYGASENDAFEKLKYDLYYMKNMSPILDLVIIFRTVKIVLFGNGAR